MPQKFYPIHPVFLIRIPFGWIQDYSSTLMAMRNKGAPFGGLSHKLISPRAGKGHPSLFYLLLSTPYVGTFGNVVVSTAVNLKAAPIAWLLLTMAGVLAGQMIYRWRKDIILTTVITVVLAMIGILFGTVMPSGRILGMDLSNNRVIWAVATFLFCYFSAVLIYKDLHDLQRE
ncbi:MAG: hypothetical protein C0392_00725 [Syntrophus sp. (in: bacteria)]|nr:hypothetical protein [Syntrophus sp. (in: bacteria)]